MITAEQHISFIYLLSQKISKCHKMHTNIRCNTLRWSLLITINLKTLCKFLKLLYSLSIFFCSSLKNVWSYIICKFIQRQIELAKKLIVQRIILCLTRFFVINIIWDSLYVNWSSFRIVRLNLRYLLRISQNDRFCWFVKYLNLFVL